MSKFTRRVPKKYLQVGSGKPRRLAQKSLDLIGDWCDHALDLDDVGEELKGFYEEVIEALGTMIIAADNYNCFDLPYGRHIRGLSYGVRQNLYDLRDFIGRILLDEYVRDWMKSRVEGDSEVVVKESCLVEPRCQISSMDGLRVFWFDGTVVRKVDSVFAVTELRSNSRLVVFHVDLRKSMPDNDALVEAVKREADGIKIGIVEDGGNEVFRFSGRLGTTPYPDYESADFRFGIYGVVELYSAGHPSLLRQH